MTLPLFPIDDEDPFASTPSANPSPARKQVGGSGSSVDFLDQVRARLASGTDADTQALREAHSAGKGRIKKPSFIPYARRYYEEQGWIFDKRETTRYIDGEPMTMDYLGLFDAVLIKDDRDRVGVQVCSKEGVTAHINKMLSDKRCMAGIRRRNLLNWWAQGKTSVIFYCWQEGGKGSRWLWKERPLTQADLDDLLAGKRMQTERKQT